MAPVNLKLQGALKKVTKACIGHLHAKKEKESSLFGIESPSKSVPPPLRGAASTVSLLSFSDEDRARPRKITVEAMEDSLEADKIRPAKSVTREKREVDNLMDLIQSVKIAQTKKTSHASVEELD